MLLRDLNVTCSGYIWRVGGALGCGERGGLLQALLKEGPVSWG